jgi:MoaA/NifB/PqqE/SkfB family radical SAM enzyme
MKYQHIRGADQLAHVVEGIALLKDFPHPKFLTCIVSEVNRAEVPAVVQFAREQGFLPVVGAYHWNVGTYGRSDELLMYDRSSTAAVFSGLLDDELIPPGYLRKFVEDNVIWLRGQKLEPCDAGRYSIAIDASGNVAPCLAFPSVGNLLESSLNEILGRFDRDAINICSDNSSCNRLDGRVVGTILRHPITALRTARSFTSRGALS